MGITGWDASGPGRGAAFAPAAGSAGSAPAGTAQGARAGTNVAEFSVSELSGKLKRLVETQFDHVRVRGEVGRVSRPGSGHLYLDLKDENAVLAGVIWKGRGGKAKNPTGTGS